MEVEHIPSSLPEDTEITWENSDPEKVVIDSTENGRSAEAIKAAHENLRLTARKAQRTFGSGFLNVGYLAACLRDDYQYYRNQIYMTTPMWEPVFEPDAAMLSSIGDGAIKINQAVPGYFNSDNLRDLTGISKSNLPIDLEG